MIGKAFCAICLTVLIVAMGGLLNPAALGQPSGPTNNTAGLVLWWPLDDVGAPGAATTADVSGNGHTGTLNNSPASIPGAITNAVSFNSGSSQSIGVTGPASVMNGLTGATLCGWVKTTSGFTFGFNDQSGQRFSIECDNGTVYWCAENGSPSYPNCPYRFDTNWHWFALCYNGSAPGLSNVTAYIDGVAQTLAPAGANSGATLSSSLGSFSLGRNAAGSYYTMCADDVRLYNRALSPAEITNQYQWPFASQAVPGATAYYIDYSAGSDQNNGLSTNAPWQHHPYMPGWAGVYNHHAGDQFIFRGGVVWPSNCFGIAIAAGGSPGNYDYYGVNSNWFSGSNFVRPVWDGGYWAPNLVYYGPGIAFINTASIEMRNVMCLAAANNAGMLQYWNTGNLTFSNLWIHGWQLTNTVTSDGSHGAFMGNFTEGYGITNIILADSEISNLENSNRWNGSCIQFGGVVNNCLLHDNSSCILFAQDVNHCTIYNINTPYTGFDPACHLNGFFMDNGNGTALSGVACYCRNTVFHDVGGGANMAYANVDKEDCYIYNCVFYGIETAQQCINVDTYSYNYIPAGSAYDANGHYTLTGLTNGVLWGWSQGANDTSCAGLTASGEFTASGPTQLLVGTPNSLVTANMDPVIVGSCYVYNNTFVLYETFWPTGIAVANRPFLQASNMVEFNNLFIGVDAQTPAVASNAYPSIYNFQSGNNLALTPSQAAAYGYTVTNLYAPTSTNCPSVGMGTSSFVSGGGTNYLTNLFSNDRLSLIRTNAWDIGAYQFLGVLPAPFNLRALSSLQ
jgi:hypothetical protein